MSADSFVTAGRFKLIVPCGSRTIRYVQVFVSYRIVTWLESESTPIQGLDVVGGNAEGLREGLVT